MHGWRARIGIVVTSPNTVCERELSCMAPEGVSIHAARMFHPPGRPPTLTEIVRSAQAKGTAPDPEVLERINENLPQVASSLGPIKPDLVVFAHTLGSMINGLEYNDHVTRVLEESAGCPALTTTTASVRALNAMGVQKLSLAAPYPAELTRVEKSYLTEAIPGLQIVSDISLDMDSPFIVGKLEPSAAYRAARQVDHEESQVVFLSGTNWRTIEVIESLEGDLGKPVITANQATMWAALRMLGIGGANSYGKLFSQN